MSFLPPELIFDILSRLPPKDLMRFLCVSKSWYALIHDQIFIKAHLQRSIETNSAPLTILLRKFSPECPPSHFFSLFFSDNETIGTAVKTEQPLKCPDEYTDILLGYSVHGLVWIHNDDESDMALWNPSIQKFKKIHVPTFEPEASSSSGSEMEQRREPWDACYGFGYDSVHDDYKLVRIVEFANEGRIVGSQVHIYSLKSNSWKRIEDMPRNCFGIHHDYLMFCNGALSCLVYNRLCKNQVIILTLSLASEKYCQFRNPVHHLNINESRLTLRVLGGCLCLCDTFLETQHDVWIMKEHGVAESWTLLYSIERGDLPWWIDFMCVPLVFSRNGEMVLLSDNNTIFFWYDLKEKSFKRAKFHGRPCAYEMTVVCWGSLCLLDGDPVIAEPETERQQKVPTTSTKRKYSSSEDEETYDDCL
ncbi:hypothetical protein ACE6H2_000244 [Prunus campanulata]